MGRVDEIYFNEKIGNYLVKDDFGVHIMFDSALLDMTLRKWKHSLESLEKLRKNCGN